MLSSGITDVLVVIVVLGIMIFIHELGHFVAAKYFGVRVLVFSLGFGKSLLHFQRGETDYRISILPLGGYVKMAGDDPSDSNRDDPGEFLSQPRWRRFVIVAMGPAMNILLAIVLLTGLYKVHYPRQAYLSGPARVGDIEPGSPATHADIRPGDTLLQFGSLASPSWEAVSIKVATSANETIPVVLAREGQTVNTTVTPVAKGSARIGFAGLDPVMPAVLEHVEPGLPAGKAGLQSGDEIVAVDGRKFYYFPSVAYAIQNSAGKKVTFDLLRAGKPLQISVQPIFGEISGEKRWMVGFGFNTGTVILHLPLKQAFKASIEANIRSFGLTVEVLKKILTGRMSPRTLSGPIGIAQVSGEAYRAGIPDLLEVMSGISLQLGIFNLLPIPVLDGGVILLLFVEGLTRRELSLAVKERFAQVGIVFLLLLVAFCVYNDLVKTFRPY